MEWILYRHGITVVTPTPFLTEIKSDRPEVSNSATFDLEWCKFKGRYEHSKTEIIAASFCSYWGEKIGLHISWYACSEDSEKALI